MLLFALLSNFNCFKNTYVGSNAGPAANSGYFNSMALGYNTSVVANNQVRVGNSSITSIGGQVGWTTVSDGRFKENLKSNVAGLSFIMELKPVTYNLNAESPLKISPGFKSFCIGFRKRKYD